MILTPQDVAIPYAYPKPLTSRCTAGLVVECEVGFYNPSLNANNQTACLPCGYQSTTIGSAAYSLEQCICNAGYYNRNSLNTSSTTDCQFCPIEADCAEPGTSLETLALTPGFWRSHERSLAIRSCYREGACKGGDSVSAPSGSNGSYCATGYGGVLCDVCEAGYVVTSDESCVLCGGGSGSLWGPGAALLGILLVLAIGAALALWKKRDSKELQKSETARNSLAAYDRFQEKWASRFARLSYFSVKLKILLSLFQVVTTLSVVYDFPRLPIYLNVLRYLSIFNLDFVRVVPLGCVFSLNFHSILLT